MRPTLRGSTRRPAAAARGPRVAGRCLAGALVAAVGVAGCGADRGAPEGTGLRVDTVDGVVHIHHSGRAPAGRLVPTLVLGEVGGLDTGSPTEFGQVRSVMADEDGRLYVADAHAFEIRLFEPDGRYVGALGRKGGGPGEIEGLHGTAWLTPDTLVVVDHGNARIALMDRAGGHLGQWPWLRGTGPIRWFFPAGPGEVYIHGFRSTGEGSGGQPSVEAVWIRYGLAGPVDTVTIPRPDGPLPGTAAICRGDGIGFFTNPYGDRLLAVPGPRGERVVAMASAYRLAFLDAAGDTVRVLSRDPEPVPLPDEEWRETAEGYAAFRQQWAGASCDGDVRRPRYRPALRDMAFDHHGRLLVEFNSPDGPALDVYDTDGRWLTTLALPERDSGVPLFLREDRLHLVTRDSLGVQRVESYRIEDGSVGP